jgi:hypothetical protein
MSPRQAAPMCTTLGVGLDRLQWTHSTSFMVEMAWITASWLYILSATSVVGGGEAFGCLATAASVWPPSWLAVGDIPLA